MHYERLLQQWILVGINIKYIRKEEKSNQNLFVGTVRGGGLNCNWGKRNKTFQEWNKVPHWVDYITENAKKYDTRLCISQLDLFTDLMK